MAQQPGSRLPTATQANRARTSWQESPANRGLQSQGLKRLSPGVYRTPEGGLQTGITPIPPAKTTKPTAPTKPTSLSPNTLAGTTRATIPANVSPQAAADALSGQLSYKLPTQEELGQLFQKRYEQEYADITAGAAERQARQRSIREQQLANMGIALDSEAYRNEQRALEESAALEAAQARSQARQFAEGAIAGEFNRAAQAQQMLMNERQYQENIRQFNKTYAQNNKKIEADILRDKNLTQLERDKLKEMVRSGDLDRALKAQLAAAERSGDANAAKAAGEKLAYAMEAKYQHNVKILGEEKAKEIYRRDMMGGAGGVNYGFA